MNSAVVLTSGQRAFLSAARRATLATIAPDERPRLVPICFVLDPHADPPVLYSPIDDKPKRSTDPFALARVRDIVARPDVTILVDRWSRTGPSSPGFVAQVERRSWRLSRGRTWPYGPTWPSGRTWPRPSPCFARSTRPTCATTSSIGR